MARVQILMSTYNGEKYLRQQIDSILCQDYTDIQLMIRDDGSCDNTLSILEMYAQRYDNISYYRGENVGSIESFLELLRKSDDNAEYYAFADQDDEWMPEKISKAIECLEQNGSRNPLLYCSNTYITDGELNVIKLDEKAARPSWGNALVQNICTGCTAVMNKALRDIVNKTKPKNIIMHDWWFYLMATLYGEVCFDSRAYIKYRQHGNNVYGAKKSQWDIWKYRFKQLTKSRGEIYTQLEVVKAECDNFDEDKLNLLELVLMSRSGIRNKIKLVKNKIVYRNKCMDDIVYRGIVLIDKL